MGAINPCGNLYTVKSEVEISRRIDQTGIGVNLNTVKTDLKLAVKRLTYHHGDLRGELIRAADAIIAEDGIEGFSLRTAAQRAGVSPAAPAHHFGNASGLLTEVAILAYQRAGQYLEQARMSGDAVAEIRAISLAYILFALENPGHFRLMLRNDLVNRHEPRLVAASREPGLRLRQAVRCYRGKAADDADSFDDDADLLCRLATLHGLAHLVLEDKAMHFLAGANPLNFVPEYLPQVVNRLYPELAQARDLNQRSDMPQAQKKA